MYLYTSDQDKLKLGVGDYSCNWGIHIAGLYSTEEERDEIVYGYISEGLKSGDLELYVPCEESHERFKENIANCCPHCKEKLEDEEHLILNTSKELYYPSGEFLPNEMFVGFDNFFNFICGHSGVELTVDANYRSKAAGSDAGYDFKAE